MRPSERLAAQVAIAERTMAEYARAERIERGRAILAEYAEADGGKVSDPDAWMLGAAAIADILHALDALDGEAIEAYQGDVERVLNLARLHYEEERENVEEVTA